MITIYTMNNQNSYSEDASEFELDVSDSDQESSSSFSDYEDGPNNYVDEDGDAFINDSIDKIKSKNSEISDKTASIQPHTNDFVPPVDSSPVIKLLSQGTFGCAYYPYIDCDGNIDVDSKYLSKIQKKTTFDREISIYEKIKNIPRHSYYFAPIEQGCPIEMEKFQEMVDVTKCNVLEKFIQKADNKEKADGKEKEDNENKDNEEKDNEEKANTKEVDNEVMYSSKVRYIPGTTLAAYLKFILFSPDSVSQQYQTLARTFHVCQYALTLLQTAKLVHYDVKLDNIMYNTVQRAPQFIDFGLSFYGPDLNADTAKTYLYTSDFYPYWPLDSFLESNRAHQKMNGLKERNKLVDKYKSQIAILFQESMDLHPNKTEWIDKRDSYFTKYKETELGSLETMGEKMYTWDMYGLAVSYFLRLKYLYDYPPAAQWADVLFSYIFSDRDPAANLTPIQ